MRRPEALVKDIIAGGGAAMAMRTDAADEAVTSDFFAAVDRRLGPVTALVNNAGVTGPVATLDQVDAAVRPPRARHQRGRLFPRAQAGGSPHGDRLRLPGGAVVNVSSRAAELGGANHWVHYAASKGAVDSFTIGAARELGPRGIRVNAVSPGLINIGVHAKSVMHERMEQLLPTVPLHRAGTAEEVAKVILWLLSDEAAYVTGAVVPVSGGR